MSAIDRCAGLVFGFVMRDGRAVALSDENLAPALEGGHDWLWLHLSLADHRARRFLESFAVLPEEARALILSSEERIQLTLLPEGAFGLLPDIERDFADHSLGAGRFAFWLNGRHLVTARRHPLRGSEQLRHAVEAGHIPATPALALAQLQEHFVALVEARLTVLTAELGRIEDQVLADRFADQRALGTLRRELSRYVREFSGLRSAITRASSARRSVVESPLLEHLPPLLQDVEDFDRDAAAGADRARLIYEEIETRIASTTNRSLSALTVISTLLLPPTFVAGLFGMNVPGLPWSQDKAGFWIVCAFCAALIVVSYAVLRRFRILP